MQGCPREATATQIRSGQIASELDSVPARKEKDLGPAGEIGKIAGCSWGDIGVVVGRISGLTHELWHCIY